ncbi:hypothetical protein GGR54DRAFT_588464 [Hypoxylon sp. NC1633]|nr:hypothetical protein GGR54DRAFT_588464 [Hypoxylon sp. NC1633]
MPDISSAKSSPEAKRTTGTSRLLQLPAEIVLLLGDFLPQVDAVCFALACKALFFLIGDRDRMRLEEPDKETLLFRLEPEVIGRYYCHFRQSLIRIDENEPPPQSACFYTLSLSGTMFELPYHKARLVTNYGLYGPQHGFPPSSLSCQFQISESRVRRMAGESKSESEIRGAEAWTAKLIDNELFLSCTHSRWGFALTDSNSFDAETFLHHVPTYRFYICQHMSVGDDCPSTGEHCSHRLGVNVRTGPDYHGSSWCKFCMTDWDFSIEWVGHDYGWRLTVKTYHCMGKCRSPNDRHWEAMRVKSSKIWRDVPGGDAKRRWISNDPVKLQ